MRGYSVACAKSVSIKRAFRIHNSQDGDSCEKARGLLSECSFNGDTFFCTLRAVIPHAERGRDSA